jgi:translation initiation factor IF-1
VSGDAITCRGVVVEAYRAGTYGVDVMIGSTTKRALCKLSGRMRTAYVRVVAGDDVEVELGAYDTSRGRIVFRGQRRQPGAAA